MTTHKNNSIIEGFGRMIKEGQVVKKKEKRNAIKCPVEAECKQAFDGTVFAIYKGRDVNEQNGFKRFTGHTIESCIDKCAKTNGC